MSNFNPYMQMPYGQYPQRPMWPQTGAPYSPGVPSAPQSVQQPQQIGPDWIMVTTIKQAEQVSVQPGQKAWVMSQAEPVFALRTADNMGLITTDYYRFEKFDPATINTVDTSTNYITAEQLEERLAAFADSLKSSSGRSKKEALTE